MPRADGSGNQPHTARAVTEVTVLVIYQQTVKKLLDLNPELAERLRAEDPGLRVLYTSGHTAGVPGTQLADVDEQHFLPKPYRPSTLLEIVRNCLDAKN